MAKATGHYQGNIAGQEKDLEIKILDIQNLLILSFIEALALW